MRWGKVTFLGLVIAVALTAYAVGAGSSSSKRVVFCAAKKSGAVTLASHGKCGKGENKVSLAKQGPAGPVGPSGSKGDPGAAGSAVGSVNTGIIETSSFGTFFGAPSGISGPTLEESDVWGLTPAGAPITARDLSISIPFALGSLATVTAALHVNGADSALSCTIVTGTSSCQNTTDAVTIPPGSHISVRTTLTGQGSSVGTLWSFGWRAVP